jgi:hypothetical protein
MTTPDQKLKALSVVRREEENEARAHINEADRHVGTNNVAAHDISRRADEAGSNANNLAEVGATHGFDERDEPRPDWN